MCGAFFNLNIYSKKLETAKLSHLCVTLYNEAKGDICFRLYIDRKMGTEIYIVYIFEPRKI